MWGARSFLEPYGPGCECLGSCRLQCMNLPRTRRLGCESLPKTMRSHGKYLWTRVWDLAWDAADLGASPCLGPCWLECKYLSKTMRAHGESLHRTCRFGFETMDAAGSGVSPCLWPLGSGVNPCLGPVESDVRPCPGPCGLECEFLLRTLRARVWFLAYGPYMRVCESLPSHCNVTGGSGVSFCLGQCRLVCETLPMTL